MINRMDKYILILNLTIKTIIDFIIVCSIMLTVGIVIFISVYLYKSIENAYSVYQEAINNK